MPLQSENEERDLRGCSYEGQLANCPSIEPPRQCLVSCPRTPTSFDAGFIVLFRTMPSVFRQHRKDSKRFSVSKREFAFPLWEQLRLSGDRPEQRSIRTPPVARSDNNLIPQPAHHGADAVGAVVQAGFFVHRHGDGQRRFDSLVAYDARKA